MSFHAKHYTPSNSILIISGDITQSLAQAKVTEYFGNTLQTKQVPDLWLTHHPKDGLKSRTIISSTRILDDTLSYAKFLNFQNHKIY